MQADILLASQVGPGDSREMLEVSWMLSLPLSVLQLSSVQLAALGGVWSAQTTPLFSKSKKWIF